MVVVVDVGEVVVEVVVVVLDVVVVVLLVGLVVVEVVFVGFAVGLPGVPPEAINSAFGDAVVGATVLADPKATPRTNAIAASAASNIPLPILIFFKYLHPLSV